MPEQNEHYRNLVKLLLPAELFEYFAITRLVVEDSAVTVFLDELDIKPTAYSD